MTRKALVLAAMSLACSPALSADKQSPQVVSYPLVHQVMCEGGDIRGTAFRVAPTLFATAAHVAALDGCSLDGDPVKVAEINGILDSAVIQAGKPKDGAFPISCAGYESGQWYYGIGYANGDSQQELVPVYAIDGEGWHGMQVFSGGLFIPGMSGGPVLDSQGRAVGMVNARNVEHQISFSRPFKDTILCRS